METFGDDLRARFEFSEVEMQGQMKDLSSSWEEEFRKFQELTLREHEGGLAEQEDLLAGLMVGRDS